MKAQGLPLNTIVLGALAVLVLVILAAAFVPSIRNVFLSIFGIAGGDAYSTCDSYCLGLSGKWSSDTAASGLCIASYCTAADLDADGDSDYCPEFKTSCSFTTTDGVTVTVTGDATGCDYSIGGAAAAACP